MGLFLHCKAYSVGLHVHPYANIILLWVLETYSKFWDWEVRTSNFVFFFYKIILAISGPLVISLPNKFED